MNDSGSSECWDNFTVHFFQVILFVWKVWTSQENVCKLSEGWSLFVNDFHRMWVRRFFPFFSFNIKRKFPSLFFPKTLEKRFHFSYPRKENERDRWGWSPRHLKSHLCKHDTQERDKKYVCAAFLFERSLIKMETSFPFQLKGNVGS